MARSAAGEKKAQKKTANSGTARGRKKISSFSQEEHETAAYFNWLNRGAPIGDDQYDWFTTMRA